MKIAEVLGSKGTEENIHAGKQVVEKHETTQKSQHSDSNGRHTDPQNHGDRFMMCLLVVALGNRHQSTHQVSLFFLPV